MNRFVVYTAIFGNYDILKNPLIVSPIVDYICFTDNKKLRSNKWKIILFEKNNFEPALKNRYLKLLAPYTHLYNYDYSIYVDGSILIKDDVYPIFQIYNNDIFVCSKHPQRNCLYQEIEQCLLEGRGDKVGLFRQGLFFQNEGMPCNYSLSDNKVIFRNHQSKIVKKIMEEWWEQVYNYSGRDQVCLPFVLWKNDMRYKFFMENLESNLYFEIGPHRHEIIRRLWRFLKRMLDDTIFNKIIFYFERKFKTSFIKWQK